jgi:hypothetical protein
LKFDPPELFTSELPNGSMNRGPFGQISAKLSSLPESDLIWISALLDDALLRGQAIDGKIKTPNGTACRRSQKEKSRPQVSTNFPRRTCPLTSPIRGGARIHHRFLIELRHGWVALGHFGGSFKMTILRRRKRPHCLGSKVSDGLIT